VTPVAQGRVLRGVRVEAAESRVKDARVELRTAVQQLRDRPEPRAERRVLSVFMAVIMKG
jgi:hypothetical protein